ncbi:MAG: helix-turn-helix transcriptional regulator [Bryobacteraceae bacterium]|jgi:transcriptional regulator with XRE-family HTH domain
MTQIGIAIRNTRKNLGKTMAEFAEMIGCKQSTISRYEAGRLTPSRAVLIVLLQLAKGADREIILERLGVDRSTRSEWSERDLLDALKTFEDYSELVPLVGFSVNWREPAADDQRRVCLAGTRRPREFV